MVQPELLGERCRIPQRKVNGQLTGEMAAFRLEAGWGVRSAQGSEQRLFITDPADTLRQLPGLFLSSPGHASFCICSLQSHLLPGKTGAGS